MIDYEKLKRAHELAEKYRLSGKNISIHFHYNEDNSGIPHYYNLYSNCYASRPISQGSIDDIIQKLEELTKPEPRFMIGDKLWYEQDQEIASVVLNENSVNWDFHDKEFFLTKSELIDAKIKLWESKREHEVCQHEPDELTCITNHIPQQYSKKCKKCGEFYK